MRIQHKMICQPSCRNSIVKVRGVREEKGGKDEEKRRKTEKILRRETKVTLI